MEEGTDGARGAFASSRVGLTDWPGRLVEIEKKLVPNQDAELIRNRSFRSFPRTKICCWQLGTKSSHQQHWSSVATHQTPGAPAHSASQFPPLLHPSFMSFFLSYLLLTLVVHHSFVSTLSEYYITHSQQRPGWQPRLLQQRRSDHPAVWGSDFFLHRTWH